MEKDPQKDIASDIGIQGLLSTIIFFKVSAYLFYMFGALQVCLHILDWLNIK